MSQLNIQFTHLHVEKTKKKYFFWQKKLTIFVADPNQMIGSNCCSKVPVTHLNTEYSECWSVDFEKECPTWYMVNNFKQNGGCFSVSSTFMNFRSYIGWRLTMNNKSEPEGRRDADQSRKPRTQLQKNSEFFEKLEQLEQK